MYVLTLDGEPIHAYSKIELLEKECRDWFDAHSTDFEVNHRFNMWVEDRNWYGDDEEQAWDDFIEEQFENGSWGWGAYDWYEVALD